ncbi:unnamed protein product [Peronospora destructor]|uniref:Uncharacterized protein n=1 Tax=Peronospora destructor TaxID=86335 RepID=A0AAV0T4N4_9STRA|nr:unnamed protein product [Peronospora destructor]
MKMTIAAIALAYLVSFVASNHLNAMGKTMTSDQAMTSDTNRNQATPSADQTILMIPAMRGQGGQGTPSDAAVGVISNKVDAKGNNILISKSNILISKSDRVMLAHTIKEMLSNSPEAGPVSSMSTDDLFALLTRLATNSAMLSHAVGIISAAKSGHTGALAGHVVGLLRAAAVPAADMAAPVVAPTAATLSTPTPRQAPAVTPVDTPASLAMPMAPTYLRSPMSPSVALAAATTTST